MASIAFIGLGNMGGPMAANLVRAGHTVTAFDLVEASRAQAKSDGAGIADSSVAAVKGAAYRSDAPEAVFERALILAERMAEGGLPALTAA